MSKLIAAALAACAVAAPTVTGPASAESTAMSPQAIADELMAADRAFSATASTSGLVDALGAMFADSVVMPTPAREFAVGKEAALAALRANSAAAKADWSPLRAGISADGTQGFTYGFMTIREAGKPDRRAKYLSYWVKRPEGWRVAFYKRAGSPEGVVSTAARPPALPGGLVAPRPDRVEANVASVTAVEKAFSDRAQQIGVGRAFVEFGSADAMNMGPGSDFLYGNEAIGVGVSGGKDEVPPPIHWSAERGALAASSGDLGLTWGYIRLHKPEADKPASFPFFTVWRRAAPDQPWRYVAE